MGAGQSNMKEEVIVRKNKLIITVGDEGCGIQLCSPK
jgi:hypothetical protein